MNVKFIAVNDTTSLLKDNWRQIWITPFKRQRLITGSLIMLIVVIMLPFFFGYIEKRPGLLLNDWVLAQLPAHNESVLIFAIIWGMILLIFIRAIYNPSIYITYCWTYIFVCLVRIVTISLVPLAPPTGFIPLTDPLTSIFYGHAVITKDLFFSGHTATLTLIALCLERKTDKLAAFAATVIVAFLLLVQHVHYTIDILAAPIIVYALYLVTRHFLYKTKKSPQPKAAVSEVYSIDK